MEFQGITPHAARFAHRECWAHGAFKLEDESYDSLDVGLGVALEVVLVAPFWLGIELLQLGLQPGNPLLQGSVHDKRMATPRV